MVPTLPVHPKRKVMDRDRPKGVAKGEGVRWEKGGREGDGNEGGREDGREGGRERGRPLAGTQGKTSKGERK
jgi:hypothetical protein